MKMKTFTVYGLFRTQDCQLNLSDSGLTYVHAVNATGKSTLLRLMYSILTGDEPAVRNIPFDRADLTFSDGTNLVVENEEDVFRIMVIRNEVPTSITVEELVDMFDAVYMSPDRSAVRKMDGRLVPALEAYANELHDEIIYAKEHKDLIEVVCEDDGDMTDEEIIFWSKDLKAKLDFIDDAGFGVGMPSGIRFPPTRYDLVDERETYIKLARSIEEYVKRNYLLAESLIVYMDIINGLLNDKHIYIKDNSHLGVELDSGTSLSLSYLSSGERQIMIMFYRLLFHAVPGSIVLLDEPEVSLHVSWQQKLSGIFLDICRLRDLQIIAATHSPQVIHDRWDLATEMRVDFA
ncbi:MAG: ATP-binding protein [Thermoplasmatales archaeon]|jgi:ABC-type cobalamin/Fe3+-siderophores transport system ATPase subunit|nr:ATP-binding protein [Thermoplasmatales archaeon]